MNIEQMKARLIEIIIAKSFQYRDNPPFTLASGKTSSYYFNCKPTTLDPEGMNLIGGILFHMLADTDVTAAGGLTLGADALADALAVISYQQGRPIKAFIVRKDVKDHGTKSALEGDVQAGEKVVILDDVITTGGSTITAIERARAAGLIIERVIALIDREEGGRQNILAWIPRVDAVVTRSEIMEVYGKKQLA
ncbi:MAG TPA: orotate phosphoribosyltransferase [Syntrophales bacterium]|jgi:orotate phosphoribosyltransferase|nr:orotate phosphoribosyltransferase [Syntrophales bacterium]HOU78021.1 orotate phosphoribosyltransferase [Syntrophales bacterium]HPC33014.1 orotate phosphoribosyltransferase [Syntrophales bacterium]HQG34366.1 orotate phosphoribosyltransferase [Syntrophales bacterium]HQI36207.1 orotate phosphoribosyltransferase [Syntrophales bacterium]